MKIERLVQAFSDGDYMIINTNDKYVINVDYITVAKYDADKGLTFTVDGITKAMFSGVIIENLMFSIGRHGYRKD